MLRAAGERVVEMRGVLKSMLGMHYASDEFAGPDIEAFGEQLRAYSPFVRSIGMFGSVDGALRADYERYLAASGGGEAGILVWDENDGARRSGPRDRYAPIESIDPLDAAGKRFIGTDLGSVPAIAGPLERAVASGEGFVARVPVGWPVAGDALLLQPVYLSAQPPEGEQDRLDGHLGGIWVAIDLAAMFTAAREDLPAATISLTLETPGATPVAPFEHAATTAGHGIDLGFGRADSARTWRLGDSELTMALSAELLAPGDTVAAMLSGALLAALLGVAATVMLYQQRLVRGERAKAERTLESISDAVITIDGTGRCLYANPTARAWFVGESHGEEEGDMDVLRRGLAFTDGPNGASLPLEALMDDVAEATDGRITRDVGAPRSSRPCSTYALTLSRMAASASAVSSFILVLQNVSKERELTAELERRAHRDSLTGCWNRFHFERHLAALVEELPLTERRHAICFIDLDRFKIVNDTCGHPAGDRLLCELTEGLTSRLRSGDVLARLGGDEFGVIIEDVTPAEAERVANGLHEHFQSAAFEHEGRVFPVRGSIGMAEIGERNRELKAILKAADIACYAAKGGGRNALVIHSEDDESMARRADETNWLPVLEKALDGDGFELLLQPIRALGAGEPVVEHEFLLRLVGESGERLLPPRFLDTAERHGLLGPIDRWVVATAFAHIAAAGERAVGARFSINLSAPSLADPELVPWLATELERHALEPERFRFEIGEEAVVANPPHATALIDALHGLGAAVALDDFGATLGSLTHLPRLPIDTLKLDERFARDVVDDPVARETLLAVTRLARALGIETVAEAVESGELADELAALGVDRAQGWHFGRPATFAETFARATDGKGAAEGGTADGAREAA